MRIFATEQLGPRQSLTPEGYLLCEAVPIARTGSQLYAAHELPFLESGLDGLITIIREESEVFRPETMASYEGKSVTIRHSFVDPDSWTALTKGTVQNVRRGYDDDADLLLADLLITDAEAIEKVRVQTDANGRPLPGQETLREVSCGYEADYVQDRPGVAFQRNIVGNHVALVERGRAGPRCSIQDGEIEMTTKTPATLLQRLLKAIKTGDASLLKRTADEAEAEIEAEKKQAEDDESELEKKETADAIATLTATVGTLAKTVDALVKGKKVGDEDEETDPAKKKAEDEETELEKKETADSMRDTVVRAEILVPGFSMPTTDSVTTRDGVAIVQRKILADAMKTADGKEIVTAVLGGRTLDAMTADAVQLAFVGASEVARTRNNARGIRHGVQTKDFGKTPPTIAEINARNAEFWKTKS